MNFTFPIRRPIFQSIWTILLLIFSCVIILSHAINGCSSCNGKWNGWESWSECAGGICNEISGRMTRMRSCLNNNRTTCNQRASKTCLNRHSCLGDWGAWSEWSSCAFNERWQECGKNRTRKCDNLRNLDFAMCAGGIIESRENISCKNCFPTTKTIIQTQVLNQNSTEVTILRSQFNNYNLENFKKQQQKIFVIVGAGVGGFAACAFIIFFVVHVHHKKSPGAGSRYKNGSKLRCISHSSLAAEGYSASGITSPSTEVFEFNLNDLPVRDIGSRSASNVSANNEFTFLRTDDRSQTVDNASSSRLENVYWEINDSRSINARPYSFAEELPLSKKLAGSKHSLRPKASSKQISEPSLKNQTVKSERLVVDNILYSTFQP